MLQHLYGGVLVVVVGPRIDLFDEKFPEMGIRAVAWKKRGNCEFMLIIIIKILVHLSVNSPRK